jgi:Zn-dependent alcohol dehydrogenase
VTPKAEPSPDPTGILGVQQAYQMCSLGGHLVTTSLVEAKSRCRERCSRSAASRIMPVKRVGASPMRDIPRFVEMLDKGLFDAQSLATTVVPLDRMLDGYEQAAYRTTVNRHHDGLT